MQLFPPDALCQKGIRGEIGQTKSLAILTVSTSLSRAWRLALRLSLRCRGVRIGAKQLSEDLGIQR